MFHAFGLPRRFLRFTALSGLAAVSGLGCTGGSFGNALDLVGSALYGSNGSTTIGSGGSSNPLGGGAFGTGTRANVDPCTESTSRKFVRVSMRNLAEDHVHYFLIMIAFVNGSAYPDGAVCATDVSLYTSNGYVEVPDGQTLEIGNICVIGPALYRFHDAGQFRAGGGATLASAIGPAQGSNPTYDAFFTATGASLPVPNVIYFHNPGTGDGAPLKVSVNNTAPCSFVINGQVASQCTQDAWYYVDDTDQPAGTTALGAGSFRRVPNEIQGTGCQCGLGDNSSQTLAPSGATASNARCNEIFRGGLIEYVFMRNDTNPPFPQLVWRVTDGNGGRAHNFDSRAGLP